MKALLISHTCQSVTEGQPRARQIAALPGVELHVLVPDRWQHYGQPRGAEAPHDPNFDFRVGRVRWPWISGAQFYLHWYPQLGKFLRELQPDIIDLWEEPWSLVSAQTCWLRRRYFPKTKIISETEQNISKHLPFPFERFRRYSLREADFLIGRSLEAVQVAEEKGYRGPSECVPNGVDDVLFHPLDRAACRRKLLPEVSPDAFIAGYVGRLVPEKGLDDVLEALGRCSPKVHLVTVGAGPMAEPLREQAQAKGLADRVHILPPRKLEELPEVMNGIDALLLVSRTTARWKEQFGRVIIEAHCCETPVIGSDSGAIPEVVGEGGLVVPEQNPAKLAEALDALARDPEMCRRMGVAGRERATAECSWRQVAARMVAIYERVLASSKVVSLARG